MSISITEYQQRRQRLMAQLPAGSVALIPAAELQVRNRDSEYAFRQHSDFHYLTGFPEPDALLVLIADAEQPRSVLFCLPRNLQQEIWTGYRAGAEGAVERFGMDLAFTLDDLDEHMPALLHDASQVLLPMGQDARAAAIKDQLDDWRQALFSQGRSEAHVPQSIANIDPLIHAMRLIKSPAEQELMRRAGQLSAAGHVRAMQYCQPGVYEYQLEAEILHSFGLAGARFPAYSTIVGAGANGCILHYIDNSKQVEDGDLVLIDAGAEVDNYAGDITRTFPANGKFSEPQKALYEVVLEAQRVAIAATKPGNHWNQPHEEAVKVLTAGLLELGLLEGELDELIETAAYRPFYMHRTGHWLGLDVHDVGEYKTNDDWRPLEPGMVLTVEPGLYIAPDCETVDPKWRGIGIRIEDDVLVTESGCEVLSAGVPKTIDEIEALMAAR